VRVSDVLQFDLKVTKEDFALSAAADIPLTGITALSGPSGSGKTTLLRALAGLEPSAKGQVTFAGENWTKRSAAKRGVGYVFQDSQLFPHMNVQDNLEYGARRRDASQGLLDAVIEALDLRPLLLRAPQTLSGGETRRVALGRALASAPRVLFMDEPLTGLDRARKEDLMPYIARAVAGFDVPAIYVTHSSQEISFLADRVLFIDDGKLTGWSGATPRLIGQVLNVAPGQVNLALGDRTLWLNGQGAVGEIWAVPLGRNFHLSTQDPGVTNAALTMKARMVHLQLESGQCQINVGGQHLALPWVPGNGPLPQEGDLVWLSLPHLAARPIQVDLQSDSDLRPI